MEGRKLTLFIIIHIISTTVADYVKTDKFATQYISNDTNFPNDTEIRVEDGNEFPKKINDALYGVGSWDEKVEASIAFVGFELGEDWWDSDSGLGCKQDDYWESNSSSDFYQDKIVLVRRGDCTFMEKVDLAIENGAAAISIINLSSSPTNAVRMDLKKLQDRGEKMVAVSTTFNTGQIIMDNYLTHAQDNNNLFYMQISASPGQMNFERIIVIIICLSFLVLLIISLIWVLFYYFQRFRLLHRQYKSQKKQEKAMKKAFSKMRVEVLTKSCNLVKMHEETCCAICIDNFEPGAVVRHLTCTHVYHKKCIDPWLIEKGTCPQCNSDILKTLGLGEAVQRPVTVSPAETGISDTVVVSNEETLVETSHLDNVAFEDEMDVSDGERSVITNEDSVLEDNAHTTLDEVSIDGSIAISIPGRPAILPGMTTAADDSNEYKTTTGFPSGQSETRIQSNEGREHVSIEVQSSSSSLVHSL